MSVYPPQHQHMPPGVPGTSLCGNYDGYANFNNGGAGFTPDPGTTLGVARVQAGGAYLANTRFDVLWRTSAVDRGCAAAVEGSSTDKSFTSSPAKKYVFTVYFRPGNSPPSGTDVLLEIGFQ